MIDTNGSGHSALLSESLQYLQDTCSRQAYIHLNDRTVARIIIHDPQSAEATSICQTLTHEVHAPAGQDNPGGLAALERRAKRMEVG